VSSISKNKDNHFVLCKKDLIYYPYHINIILLFSIHVLPCVPKGLSPITPTTSYAIHCLHVKFFLSIAAVSAGTFERDAVKVDLTSQEFRSLAVSSDGKHLAAGDCNGNLHIYNLQTSDYTCLQVNSDT